MAVTSASHANGSDAPPFPSDALIAEMERTLEPALLFLPGGRIAAVNRAAARLTDLHAVGMPIGELLQHHNARRADGRPLIPGDLPYARALRGEIVAQGERFDAILPDGSVYRIRATSTPIVIDGKVVAALSIWHDFNKYVLGLAGRQVPPDTTGLAKEQ